MVPAALTPATLLPMRVGALLGGVKGPWSSLADSTRDIAVRTLVVFAVVGFVSSRA